MRTRHRSLVALCVLLLLGSMAYSQLDPAKNFADGQVSTGYDASATSITLSTGDGAKFPDPSTDGAFNFVWGEYSTYPNMAKDPNVEICRCTARSGDVLTIVRAQEGTTAHNHNTGGKTYRIVAGPTAKLISDIRATYVAKDSSVKYNATTGHLVKDSSGVATNGPAVRGTASDSNATKGDIQKPFAMFHRVIGDSSLIGTGTKIPLAWYAAQNIIVDSLLIRLYGGSSPSATVDIHWGTDISGSGTALITSPDATTSVTTFRKIATFNNATVAAGNSFWLEFDAASGFTNVTASYIELVLVCHYNY